MKIIHLSYAVVKPVYKDPEAWLKRISFSVGVMEGMASYAEVSAFYHIHFKGDLIRNNVKYYFTQLGRWQLIIPMQFHSFVKKLNPDVVIVHGLNSPWQVLLLRWTLGNKVKIIAQHHAERPLKDFRQYLQRWADRYIHAYLFASNDLGKLWTEKKQIRNAKKIKEIMGTSSPFYPINREEAKTKTRVKPGIIYLWVGGLDENKDPLTVAKSFLSFLNQKLNVHLYFIYQTSELELALINLIKQSHSGTDRIHLVGKIVNEDLQNWYNSADFIISSSHYEGSGIAVCEGLSCGCIPILTDIPSFRMMTDGGRFGLLYKAGDSDSLLKKLNESINLNFDQQRKQVIEQFNQKLSFEANARQIKAVIETLN